MGMVKKMATAVDLLKKMRQETIRRETPAEAAQREEGSGLQQPSIDPIMLIASLLAPGMMNMAKAAPRLVGNESGALLPEQLAKMNSTNFYHGSGTPGLTREALDPLATSHESLFGQGLYTTDNPEIAQSYAARRAMTPSQRALYKVRLNATKGADLEHPLESEISDVLLKQADSIDKRFGNTVRPDYAPGDDTFSLSQNLKEKIRNGTIKSNQDLFHHFREGIKDISVDEGIPTSEWVQDFQEIHDGLKQKGFQVMRHTGGLRVGKGKTLHEVAILLDPSALKDFSQVKP